MEIEPHVVYYLGAIINRSNDLNDHKTVEYTRIPNTPEFSSSAAALSFRDTTVLGNAENRAYYRCALPGDSGSSAFSANHIKAIRQERTVIL